MAKQLLVLAIAVIGLQLLGASAPARAMELCLIADPKDPTLNVRATPRGDLVGQLKNGHPVFVLGWDDVEYADGSFREWTHIAIEKGGTLKPYGWVFRAYLDCKTKAPEHDRYPILVGPQIDRDPETFGVSIDGYMKPEANLCYYYGDGGITLSVSDAVLQRFQERGFSLNSLCLGLMSAGVLFDPETGRRLPSMLHIDYEALEKFFQCSAETHKTLPPGCDYLTEEFDLFEAMSNEFPIDLPDCFKDGAPYSDCAMNYDMATGRKIGAAERAYITAQGEGIEAALRLAMEHGVACKLDELCGKTLGGTSRWGLDGYFVSEVLIDQDGDASPVAKALGQEPNFMTVTAYDISPAFPRGFGYTIGADGGAGPSANLQSAKLALGQKDRVTRSGIKALGEESTSP